MKKKNHRQNTEVLYLKINSDVLREFKAKCVLDKINYYEPIEEFMKKFVKDKR